jgi:hypothetical protein
VPEQPHLATRITLDNGGGSIGGTVIDNNDLKGVVVLT